MHDETAKFTADAPHVVALLQTAKTLKTAYKNVQAELARCGAHTHGVYPVHATTRKSLGDMTRKLSVTESRRSAQLRGTFSRRKSSVASANWAHVA